MKAQFIFGKKRPGGQNHREVPGNKKRALRPFFFYSFRLRVGFSNNPASL
jgi:hypothetical protein